MSTDKFYAQGCEIRVGAMADAVTDPTTWYNLEYVSLELNPGREERDRPLIGVPLQNNLDDRETVQGISRPVGSIVVPADTRQLARWMRLLYGAPTTTGASAPYTHTWASGVEAPQYAALQVKMGATDIRIFRGLTLGSIAMEAQGEQVDDFNVTIGLAGLSEAKLTAWVGASATAVSASAPVRRAVFAVDGAATARTMQVSLSYDRKATGQVFLSQNPTISSVDPEGGTVTGQAQFRAVGLTYDTMEAARTAFEGKILGYGKIANHKIEAIVPKAHFAAAPVSVPGPGLIERTWPIRGNQDATNPAFKLAITNDVATYAS